MLCFATTSCVFSRCMQIMPLCKQQEVLFPPFLVLLPLFAQEAGGVQVHQTKVQAQNHAAGGLLC